MRHQSHRHGSILVYSLIAMSALVSVVSLGVDVSHVRLVKVQLQCAADAAARAAAQNLSSGVTAAQNAAIAAAGHDKADGTSVVITTSDIAFGTWANGTFTLLTGGNQSSANAIQVTCSRSAAKGNAVALYFTSFIGITSSDVSASAIAKGTPTSVGGFIGYAGIDAKNNTFFGGYNSSVTTSPTQNTADVNITVGSNSSISAKNNDEIDGNVVLGPSATCTDFTVLGNTTQQNSDIAAPAMPTWSPGTNPGSIPQAYTVNSGTVLPGGTYWFTSLTINADLTFSGAATVYVNGAIAVGGTLAPTSGIPSDLTIYQYGSTTFGDSDSNGMNITAAVIAPGSDFTAKNNLEFYGSALFNTITTKNNAEFYYDEAAGPANGTYKVSTVQ